MKKVSKSTKETTQMAKMFMNKILKDSNKLKGALVVGLSGDLGVGKTTFIQAAARDLGVKNKISSPTFVIMKKYPINLDGYKFLFHIDAYRLKNEQELLYLGWEKVIKNKEHLVFIEWPENVSKVIPLHSKLVCISHTKQGSRSFEFKQKDLSEML